MSNELNFYDRQKLAYWLRTKQSLRNIAKIMRRDVAVLSREIKRNGSGQRIKYRADTAQRLCNLRRHKRHRGKMDKYPKLREYVEKRLLSDWSPEQIAGRLKEHPPEELIGQSISHESIYYYIYEKAERHKKLYHHLRTGKPRRRVRGRRKSQKINIPGRIPLNERPDIINRRARYGDWESDTVEFKRNSGNPFLSVQYERKSMLVRMHKINKKTAEDTKEAIIKTAESVLPDLFQTVTLDNGAEGAKHLELQEYYPHLKTYFCDPFCSWQKGGVENTNKLIRQYFPRGRNMRNITDEEIYTAQEKLNNRPRKGLDYQTPNEIIHKVLH